MNKLSLAIFFYLPMLINPQEISINLNNPSIGVLISEVESQTDYKFAYTDDINTSTTLNGSYRFEHENLEKVLKEFTARTPYKLTIIGNNITIVSDPPAEKPEIKLEVQATVEGTVTDPTGMPIPGANVIEKGTSNGVVTNFDGEFSINVSPGAVLIFSFLGYETIEREVEGDTQLNITMETSASALDEVVLVGYGAQEKASLTGAVSVVDIPDIKEQALASGNIVKALDGRLPGITTSYNANPANAASIQIRGRGSLSSSTSPLIVIDGVPTNRGLNEIAVNDIESIQVLKDAASATIYGSRAANGVIIITTKSARIGTRVEFSTSLTAGFLRKNTIPLLNTQQYGMAQWRAARNDGVDPNFGVYSFEDHQDENGNWVLDEIILPEYLDAEQTMRPANTDWEDVISRNPFSKNYNLSISKGGESGGSVLSFDYLDSEGTTKENQWTRATLRLNSDYSLFNDRVKLGENLALIKMKNTGGSYLGLIPNIQSIVPVRTIDGEGWGGPVQGMSDRINPMLEISRNTQNSANDVRLVGSIYGDFEIFKDLHFRSTFGADYSGYWNRHMNLQYESGFLSNRVTSVSVNSGYGGSWTWNNVLTYDLEIKEHDFQVMLGQESTETYGTNMFGSREGFAIEDPNYLYLNVGESNVRNGNIAWDSSLNSYFGRLNYNYKNRYLLTGILRRDGSSRFGTNNQYAFFPSLSGGWTISQESFMDSVEWLSFLKLRYGWGKTGNQEIANYASYGQYQAHYGDNDWPVTNGTAYDIYGNDTGNLPSGYRRLQLGNPDLQWETTTQDNFGVDYAFFDSKLSGSFDYYLKTTTDILVNPPTLSVTGFGASSFINGATMKNRGWETVLSYSDVAGDFDYSISANAYHNTNEFTYIVPEAVGAYPGNGNDQTILGRPLNSLFGYVVDGIFQNQAEVDAAAVQPGKGVGRLRYSDLNNDGLVDADDRTWIGVDEPDLTIGLNASLKWKGFDFSMFWNSELGREIASPTKGYTHFFGFFGGQNYGTAVLDAWTPSNNTSTIPAITAADLNNESRFSTYFVENTSYVKLQSVVFGYDLPKEVVDSIFMDTARIFIQGSNLLTIDMPGNTFTGFDPKSPYVDYPLPTSFTLGFNLLF